MSVATSIYVCCRQSHSRIREEAIVRTKATIRLFPDIEINELNFRPIPVKVTTPIIPAVAVAKATGIIASEAVLLY